MGENLVIMHYIDKEWMDLKSQKTGIMAVAVLLATTQNSLGSNKQYLSEKLVILYVLFLHITSF